jgi:hypothetical protein
MISERIESNTSPEERTLAFFEQDYAALAEALENRRVILEGTDKSIQITKAEGWPRQQVGRQYQPMETHMQPGDWWAFRIPVRRMRQSIIVAQDQGQIGACVRILRASRVDAETQEIVPMPREGDIAQFFELSDDEHLRLRFTDDSEILHLARTGEIVMPKRGERVMSPQQANQELESFLQE